MWVKVYCEVEQQIRLEYLFIAKLGIQRRYLIHN